MREKMRYVEARHSKRGTRYYWRADKALGRGNKPVRLPDDPVERYRRQRDLNARADALRGTRPKVRAREPGTVSWIVDAYTASPAFTERAPATRALYAYPLRDLDDLCGDLPFAALDRAAVVRWLDQVPTLAMRRISRSVLLNLFHLAEYRGIVRAADNPMRGLRLPMTTRREAIWTADDCAAFLAAAGGKPWLVTAFALLRYTAQRPGDMLAMTFHDIRDGRIALRQRKTGARVAIRVHRDLAPEIEAARARARGAHIGALTSGRPVAYPTFGDAFRRARAAAGIGDLQPRDLRRAAMVNMAIVGATEAQIASVSGHSIETTRSILETYLPRRADLADEAIAKWESGTKVQRIGRKSNGKKSNESD